jgi:chemotaxis protein methyltransferase CheR
MKFLLERRLRPRLAVFDHVTFRDYYRFLKYGREQQREFDEVTERITTNETYFFRGESQLTAFSREIIPELVKRRGAGAIRIWSAGCSSGEEPYSIALSILSVLPDAARLDVKILATDINNDVLAFGEHGVYPESAVAPLTRQQRADWFEPARSEGGEKMWHVGEALRSLVAFRELNLMHAWPMKQSYQAIFCRNVAIYFDDEAQARIWNRLAGLLAPNGCLYVGHSERVNGATEKFRLEGMTTYRLKGRPQP